MAPHTHTKARVFTTCRHTHSYTQECNEPAFSLNIFRRPCAGKNTLHENHTWGICHDCRHRWQSFKVSEDEAIIRLRSFREAYSCFESSLTPASKGGRPVIVRDENPDAIDEQIEDVTKQRKVRTEERDSACTLWPGRDLTQFLMSGALDIEQNERGNHELRGGDQLEQAPEAQEFQAQELERNTQAPLDLDKPLPRIPRPATPMPGARIHPDLSVPGNKYIPRFL